MISASIEKFIKAIYLIKERGGVPKAMTIAGKLKISGAAVTDMASKLSARELVIYKKHKSIELTDKGKELALQIVRKHRLWETFLHQTLKLNLEEIHTEAEYIEGYSSAFLIEKMEEFLEFPSADPHGDPIPDENGVFANESFYPALINEEPGRYQVKRILYDSHESSHFFYESGLKLGVKIELILKFKEDDAFLIKIGKATMVISTAIAAKIFVKKLTE